MTAKGTLTILAVMHIQNMEDHSLDNKTVSLGLAIGAQWRVKVVIFCILRQDEK